MNRKRNDSIELLRCVLMLCICILHSCSLGGYVKVWFSRMLAPCVSCFIFISGYYGIKSTPLRIARLIAIAFAAVPIVGIFSWFVGYEGLSGWRIAAVGVINNWFLWAYVALMCFAPMLNLACEHPQHKTLVLPIIALCLGWGYIKELPFFRAFMPTTAGLGSYTFTMMIGVYLAAMLCRKYNLYNDKKSFHLLFIFACLTVLCTTRLSGYCSPISVVWSAILFSLFSRIRMDKRLDAVAEFIAQSTFSIFVLHANGIGFELIKRTASLLCGKLGLSVYLMYLAVGIMVFLAGFILDMPRRFVVWCVFMRRGIK